MEEKIITTSDGFSTVHSGLFDVPYHSIHGALLETDTVFINMGLEYLKSQKVERPIRIFEMGFGTGLNAIRTFQKAKEWSLEIEYTTIEAYPLSWNTIKRINHIDALSESSFRIEHLDLVLLQMHEAASGHIIALDNQFLFTKWLMDVEAYTGEKSSIDLIYYDAFAPATQSHLWDEAMMKKMYDMLGDGGILCTYCAQGAYKRTLKKVGFEVINLPGPGRKREITRACKVIEP